MNIIKVYYKIIGFYFIILFGSGLFIDTSLIFPGLFGYETNIYYFATVIHRNVFFYGLFLNILPAIILFGTPLHKIEPSGKRLFVNFFWWYQSGVLLGILGNFAGKNQRVSYFDLELIGAIPILISFVFFFLSGFKLYKNDARKVFIWNYFILIPAGAFFLLMIWTHVMIPNDISSSMIILTPFILNILQVTTNVFIYNYFIIIILSAIVYMTLIPDSDETLIEIEAISSRRDKKTRIIKNMGMPVKNPKADHSSLNIRSRLRALSKSITGFRIFNKEYYQVRNFSGFNLINRFQNWDVLRILKIQWYLQTILFLVFLFYRLQYYISREDMYISGKINVLLPLSYFIAYICIRTISRRYRQDSNFETLINVAFMFLFIYILAEIILSFPSVQKTFMFTDWMVSQHHLLLCGFFLPVFYIFILMNKQTYQKTEKVELFSRGTQKPILQNIQQLNSIIPFRFRINAWWIFTLIITVTGWFIGAIEGGLWNKADIFGFLEYPGWITILELVKPYRIIRTAALIALLFFFASLVIYRRQSFKKSNP